MIRKIAVSTVTMMLIPIGGALAEKSYANESPHHAALRVERQIPVYPFSKTTLSQKGTPFPDRVDTSRAGYPSYIAAEEYDKLYGQIFDVRHGRKFFLDKINIRGELRYHNMFNSSTRPNWDEDRSGFRLRLYFDTHVYRDWRFHTMAEGKLNIKNYDNDFKFFERYYLQGHLGMFLTTLGRFGYLMADGNIYDSSFEGVRLSSDDMNSYFDYTLGLGKTNYTKDTLAFTVGYTKSDYRLEAGLYHYKMNYGDYGTDDTNTITMLSGEYYMGDFSLGGMYLGASKADLSGAKNGYVLALKYLELKTWVRGSYSAFLKYYDQPRYTYIAHGMDGLGPWMHGFNGWGAGVNYVFGKNLVAGLEYFDLKDKYTGDKGKSTWFYISYYF